MANRSLGIPVDEFTTPSPLQVAPNVPVAEVTKMMKENKVRHLPVVENGQPIGIISDRDLRLISSFTSDPTIMAKSIMTPEPYTVSPETPLEEVAFQMSANKYGSALVLAENGDIVGIFTVTDALNALIEIVRGDV